jgi:hypothetical protein
LTVPYGNVSIDSPQQAAPRGRAYDATFRLATGGNDAQSTG